MNCLFVLLALGKGAAHAAGAMSGIQVLIVIRWKNG
jgi:hypothetical protein